jgi:site-specific recombinase XerD
MKRKKANSFLNLLESYFGTYLPTARGLSPATIRSYKTAFRVLLEFMYTEKNINAGDIRFEDLTTDILSEFLDWLEAERKCSVSTRNHRLSVLNAFSEYAQNRDFEAASVFRASILKIPQKKGVPAKRSYFTREEIKLLLSFPNAKTAIGKRDRALLCFMYASGARAQEVCELTVGDVTFFTDKATVKLLGKGNKVRKISIPADAAAILKGYIEYRKIQDKYDRHIFSSQTHEKMTVSCIEEIFFKYVEKGKAEYPGHFREKSYTPHSMRHTTATHMLEAGVPLIVVKNFLGHASIQTTQIYAEISQRTADRELKAWNDRWFLKEADTDAADTSNDMIPKFLI